MYKMIGADGQTYGPVSTEQLRQWITEGRVAGHTLIQAEGSPDWKPLNQFAEFAGDIKSSPPPFATPPGVSAYNPVIAAKASNKIAAGICGILLGGLGIHKFILGYNTSGVIMLLVSVIGGFCTFGVGYVVMHVIGLIEGVIYLTKPDEEFVRTYVDNRKEWF